jgi:oligopeptide/dipeptide ABC transporter ATP-binding protein
MTSLNPVLTVGFQVAEALRYHRDMGRREASAAALELLDQVKIPSARQRFADFPHQFSGGMRQRVIIAMALACRPELLLADEPTTALDVTIQAQVLSLLADLKAAYGMAMIFITHNLGVVASIADRVAAMYAGEIVEVAPVDQLFAHPTHPYTELLLRSIPRVDRDSGGLTAIAGQVPAIGAMPSGCRFAPRCPLRQRFALRGPLLRRFPMRRITTCAAGCAPRRARRDMADSVLTVTGLRKFFTVTRGLPPDAHRHRSCARRHLLQRARRRGFGLVSESGCANRRPGAPRCAWWSPMRARSSSRARSWSRRARRACGCCAASCRSSSRIPTPRSIRAGGSARR